MKELRHEDIGILTSCTFALLNKKPPPVVRENPQGHHLRIFFLTFLDEFAEIVPDTTLEIFMLALSDLR